MVFCVYALFYRLLYSRRTETAIKSLEKLIKRPGTTMKRSKTLRNGERSGTVNGQEHLGTIESERSNALERIVKNDHVPKTKETLYISLSFLSILFSSLNMQTSF